MDPVEPYRLALWHAGIWHMNKPPNPFRVIQGLIRARGAEANAIERFLILNDIRAELDAEYVED